MEKIQMDIETPLMKKWHKKLEKIEREKQAERDRQIVEYLIKGGEQ